jgi:hypothetical protein
MDPLTALGLASNIVQFVDFTSKLISTTQNLYVSSSGAKDEHLELEILARNIQDLAEHAKSRLGGVSGPAILSKEDGTLLDLSDQCIEVSNQLLSLLESVKVKGQHRGWDSFHQVGASSLSFILTVTWFPSNRCLDYEYFWTRC